MKKISNYTQVFFMILYFFSSAIYAETIGLFFDSNVSQIVFAAGDIRKAPESKGFTVESLDINSLNGNYPNKNW